jgi:hypothetical protein
MAQDENQSAQDDQAWFDALSGKADSAKATRLRNVLREVELEEAAKEDTTHDWQRLQFAMRREEGKPQEKMDSRFKYYALAASLLLVVGTATMLMQSGGSPTLSPMDAATVMRGTAEQVILSTAPAKEAKQLESELSALGVNVTKIDSADKVELHINLNYPVSDDVRKLLEARVIPVPQQGDLVVVFVNNSR